MTHSSAAVIAGVPSKPASNPTQIFMKNFPLLPIISLIGISLCFLSISTFPKSKWILNCPDTNIPLELTHSAGEDNPEKTNISHILFGIGGSVSTWGRRARYCELWWKQNLTRGYVWLDVDPTKTNNPWPKNSPNYRVSADTAKFKYTNWDGSRSAVRIARILKESFDLGEKNVRWFVMGDDDTVFFTENLVNALRRYDHNEMYYIGGISESVEQDLAHSYSMAYGGGGFAVSYGLAAALVGILDGCMDRYAAFYGSDHKIAACVHELGVPLTNELGFHQMDIRGSPYGLLSAHPMAPLVSLHHLDYILPLFPSTGRVTSVKKLIRSYNSDPNRILQHTVCYDLTRNWSVSISWGYSVQLYPYIVTVTDLITPLKTFLTWGSWSQSPFTFNTRVYSTKACERPIIFHVDRVEWGESRGSTVSFYMRSSGDHRRKCDGEIYVAATAVKGFNVTAAVMDPAVWSKAPRRQCCEVIGGEFEELNGVIHMNIRDCYAGESITPP